MFFLVREDIVFPVIIDDICLIQSREVVLVAQHHGLTGHGESMNGLLSGAVQADHMQAGDVGRVVVVMLIDSQQVR
jgi:hypothetical protein